ncbi:unnamed protein product [Amoebophrya sp. A25]|nr:unnamed protein product [Amoebophrya sp. A25]|eukprot:GSA25T00013556001.1
MMTIFFTWVFFAAQALVSSSLVAGTGIAQSQTPAPSVFGRGSATATTSFGSKTSRGEMQPAPRPIACHKFASRAALSKAKTSILSKVRQRVANLEQHNGLHPRILAPVLCGSLLACQAAANGKLTVISGNPFFAGLCSSVVGCGMMLTMGSVGAGCRRLAAACPSYSSSASDTEHQTQDFSAPEGRGYDADHDMESSRDEVEDSGSTVVGADAQRSEYVPSPMASQGDLAASSRPPAYTGLFGAAALRKGDDWRNGLCDLRDEPVPGTKGHLVCCPAELVVPKETDLSSGFVMGLNPIEATLAAERAASEAAEERGEKYLRASNVDIDVYRESPSPKFSEDEERGITSARPQPPAFNTRRNPWWDDSDDDCEDGNNHNRKPADNLQTTSKTSSAELFALGDSPEVKNRQRDISAQQRGLHQSLDQHEQQDGTPSRRRAIRSASMLQRKQNLSPLARGSGDSSTSGGVASPVAGLNPFCDSTEDDAGGMDIVREFVHRELKRTAEADKKAALTAATAYRSKGALAEQGPRQSDGNKGVAGASEVSLPSFASTPDLPSTNSSFHSKDGTPSKRRADTKPTKLLSLFRRLAVSCVPPQRWTQKKSLSTTPPKRYLQKRDRGLRKDSKARGVVGKCNKHRLWLLQNIIAKLLLGGPVAGSAVTLAAFAVPHTGVLSYTMSWIVGQMFMSIVVDHLGWMGIRRKINCKKLMASMLAPLGLLTASGLSTSALVEVAKRKAPYLGCAMFSGGLLPVARVSLVQLNNLLPDRMLTTGSLAYVTASGAQLAFMLLFSEPLGLESVTAKKFLGLLNTVPLVNWLGGLAGAVQFYSILLFQKKIGALRYFLLVLLGQLATSIPLDHFGLLGFEKREVTAWPIAGVFLVLLSAVFNQLL